MSVHTQDAHMQHNQIRGLQTPELLPATADFDKEHAIDTYETSGAMSGQ